MTAVRGALVNVGVTHPTQSGGVIVYPDGTSRPSTAAVQFSGGRAAQNSVLATGNTVDFYYTYTGSNSVFLPATPQRLLNVKINGRQTVKLKVVGGAVPTGATAAAVNLTASGASETNTITAYADGTARQGITSLSYDPGTTTENATVVAVGSDGAIDLDNNGTKPITLTVDLTGSYYAY